MKKEVFCYLHSHWDREWYKSFEQYRLRLCDVLEDIFNKLDNGVINSFYLDGQTIAIDDYLEIYPEKIDYVKNLIASKKLLIGPNYVLSDEFLIMGESLIRNLQIGIEEAINYGSQKEDFIGYLPDAFGHNACMPMLLNKVNINKALLWRGVGYSAQEFYWEAPDKSQVRVAFLPFGYYQDFLTKKHYKKNLDKLLDKMSLYALNDMPLLLPIGADHLACEDNIKAKIKNFNRKNNKYKMKLVSLNEYFNKSSDYISQNILSGEFRDNSNSYVLPSVISSRIYLKQENMKTQWKLIKILEPLCAFMLKEDVISSKKNNIKYIWKILLQNHAHDSICGCCIDVAHQENMIRFSKINQICDAIIDDIKAKLSSKISKKEIAVINLSNYNYTGVFSFFSDKKLDLPIVSKQKLFPIEISQDIHNIPVQEDYHYYYEYLAEAKPIPATSISVIRPSCILDENLKITSNSVENEFLSLNLNNDGSLTITNKQTNKIMENFFEIIDEADVGDSYNFSCIKNDVPLIAKLRSSKILENNPLRKILRVIFTMNIPTHALNNSKRANKYYKHTFLVDFMLSKKSKRLDIRISYENFSKDHILKLNFKMNKIIERVVSEDAFGVIERKYIPNYNYKDNLPLDKYKEINLNTNPFQRFFIVDDLNVITKGLQEYEVDKDSIKVTLIRCFGQIAKKTLATRTAAAGPPLPTPEGQCLGKHVAELALLFNNDVQVTFWESDKFYNPLVIVDGKAKTTSLKTKKILDLPEGFYLYSMSEANEKGMIIAKIFNLNNSKNFLRLSEFEKISEINLVEEDLSIFSKNEIITFNPFELKILKIQ